MAKDEPKVQMRVKKQTEDGKTVEGFANLDIRKLNRKPLAQYYRMANKFVNVENFVYHATALYQKDVAINTEHTAELFTQGYGQSAYISNTNQELPKQGKFLTNMATDGEFDDTTSFLLEEIAVELFITSEPVTTWTKGAIINPAAVSIASFSAPNHYYAISRQFELAFIRGEQKEMVKGALYEFPCPFVASGAFGASAGGFIQNGFAVPTWNKLSEIHALMSNERFRVEIRPLISGFTPQVNVAIRALLIGKRITSDYA